MAEIDLLIRGVDTDYGKGPDGNANVGNQKGDVAGYVVITPDESRSADRPPTFTGMQQPPDWCVCRISDLSTAQALEYTSTWRQALSFEWISKKPQQDSWQLKIRAARYRLSDGYGAVTEEQVDQTLDGWNAKKLSAANNEITAEFIIRECCWSPYALGGWNVAHSKFHEVAYDQATGRHDIQLTYDDQLIDDVNAAKQIARYCEIVSHVPEANRLVYRTYRNGPPEPRPDGSTYGGDYVMLAITNQTQRDCELRVMLRRFRMNPVDVDQIIAGTHPNSIEPGYANMTRDELLPCIQDKLEL